MKFPRMVLWMPVRYAMTFAGSAVVLALFTGCPAFWSAIGAAAPAVGAVASALYTPEQFAKAQAIVPQLSPADPIVQALASRIAAVEAAQAKAAASPLQSPAPACSCPVDAPAKPKAADPLAEAIDAATALREASALLAVELKATREALAARADAGAPPPDAGDASSP